MADDFRFGVLGTPMEEPDVPRTSPRRDVEDPVPDESAAFRSPLPPLALPAVVRISPWVDPVVDRCGHDPRSAYVEQYWISVIGPTATWLVRRLVRGFDDHPDGYDLDVEHAARSLGVSVSKGAASPFARALQRCVMFGVAAARSDGWAVRRRIPPISQRHLVRLPADLQERHREWIARTTTTITLDALQRAHTLAAAMLDVGDDPATVEGQLLAVGVPPPAAEEACLLATRR